MFSVLQKVSFCLDVSRTYSLVFLQSHHGKSVRKRFLGLYLFNQSLGAEYASSKVILMQLKFENSDVLKVKKVQGILTKNIRAGRNLIELVQSHILQMRTLKIRENINCLVAHSWVGP